MLQSQDHDKTKTMKIWSHTRDGLKYYCRFLSDAPSLDMQSTNGIWKLQDQVFQ